MKKIDQVFQNINTDLVDFGKQNEIEVISSHSKLSFALGVSPGFGYSDANNTISSSSRFGIGLMANISIAKKLNLGSGLAFNQFSETSQSLFFGATNSFSSQLTEQRNVKQIQVDIPFYLRYQITRKKSVFILAGFSNLLTMNQSAVVETSFQRDIQIFNSEPGTSTDFVTIQETVSQTEDLNLKSSNFYPFATANLGVNIRIMQLKESDFFIMPFYNYPLGVFFRDMPKVGYCWSFFKG